MKHKKLLMKYKMLFVLAAVFAAALTVSCEFFMPGDGESEPSGVYSIHLGEGLADKITVPESAKAGDAVTLQVTADEYINTLGIKSMDDVAEFPVSLLNSGDVTFSFVMPEQDVKVNAVFSPTADTTATLTSLSCDEGVVVQLDGGSDSFDPEVLAYIVEVEHDVDTVHLSWTTTHVAAQGVVSGETTELVEGINTAMITVTAQDGATEVPYTIVIVQKPNLFIENVRITGSGVYEGPLDFGHPDPLAGFNENIPLGVAGQDVTVTFTTVNALAIMVGDGDFIGITSKAVSFTGFNNNDVKSGTVTVQKEVNEKVYSRDYEITVYSDTAFPTEGPLATGGEVKFIRTGEGQFDELHIFRFEETLDIPSSLVSNQRVYELAFTGGAPDPAIEAEVLVVAGGGGGGKGSGSGTVRGGGGGAGGVIYYGSESPDDYTKAGTSLTLDAASYPVKVGSGSPYRQDKSPGNNGIASIFGTSLTAVGGGGGAGSLNALANGKTGGSGGGGFVGGSGGNGTQGQGNSGAAGDGGAGWRTNGGGGGGAGGPADGSNGGPGIELHIEGYAKTYAEGGYRTLRRPGTPGTGTGGDGWFTGGSGIVLVRFPYTAPSGL